MTKILILMLGLSTALAVLADDTKQGKRLVAQPTPAKVVSPAKVASAPGGAAAGADVGTALAEQRAQSAAAFVGAATAAVAGAAMQSTTTHH